VKPSALPPALAAAIDEARPTLHPLGDPIYYFEEIGSTNDVAAILAADGAREGTLVIAETQTAGRGRLGRSWFSPANAGLYVSVVLRPGGADGADHPGIRERLPLLTLAAGVALARAIERTSGLHVGLKWPNDVVVQPADVHSRGFRGRKLGGILAEAHSSGPLVQDVVLGYGLNLLSSVYPPDLSTVATSIEEELGRTVDCDAIMVASLQEMAAAYRSLLHDDPGTLLAEWRRWSPLADGAAIQWSENGVTRTGTTAGVDEQGALLVRCPTGNGRIVSGLVTWL
jgi:BirA family biotin operon repressor/biotin-[acetyl-CoA-carboxylase] ligase